MQKRIGTNLRAGARQAGGISQWEDTMKKAHQSQDTPVHAADTVTSFQVFSDISTSKNEFKKEEPLRWKRDPKQ
jgi:hypothetical protein